MVENGEEEGLGEEGRVVGKVRGTETLVALFDGKEEEDFVGSLQEGFEEVEGEEGCEVEGTGSGRGDGDGRGRGAGIAEEFPGSDDCLLNGFEGFADVTGKRIQAGEIMSNEIRRHTNRGFSSVKT